MNQANRVKEKNLWGSGDVHVNDSSSEPVSHPRHHAKPWRGRRKGSTVNFISQRRKAGHREAG